MADDEMIYMTTVSTYPSTHEIHIVCFSCAVSPGILSYMFPLAGVFPSH